MESKTCSKCKIDKSYSEFYKDSFRKDGFRPQCKLCINKCNNQYAIKNPDKIRQINKQRRIENSEYNKKWRIDNPEYDKQRRIDNPDYFKQYGKQYRQSSQGKLICKSSNHKRRALLKANTQVDKHWTSQDIKLKLKLQNNKCVYCETSIKEYYEIDHFIPLSKGGSNEASNIQLLCKDCNGASGKWDKLPHEFAKKYGKLI